MDHRLYREYELKFYLNAMHYIVIDGNKGEEHPHTWEFTLEIGLPRDDFVQFGKVEKCIQEYLEPFQNKVLNETAPFDAITPTVENMADYFAGEFRKQLEAFHGILTRVKASETPTRAYIVTLESRTAGENPEKSEILSGAIDRAIDGILEG